VSPTPVATATYNEPLELSAQLVRQWTAQCKELTFPQVFAHMLAVAETVNPNLHPQPATALWRRVGDSPCARALDPADRLWIDLFTAVARSRRGADVGARRPGARIAAQRAWPGGRVTPSWRR
jgi:hypothetical protein